ncbi:MAG: TatD family hydrolase [Flavobacteriales bacterium]|nr:TatD family hydrolase [Flavobacteriales bacterium]
METRVSWVDTHCHLYASAFDQDRDEAMLRATESGVERLLLPNIDVESIGPLLELVQAYPERCFPMMGLHPCHVDADWSAACATILEALDAHPCIAVGEIGMDLFRGKETREHQMSAFHAQIGWALERDLPVVLHVREAFEDTFHVLDQYTDTALRGVFHCFTGGRDEAERVKEYGSFYFGLGGVSTFKNGGLDLVIPHLPSNRIVLETDSPYLAPTPYRGKRNEPAYTALVAQRVADLLEVSLDALSALTSSNAEALFGLDPWTPKP